MSRRWVPHFQCGGLTRSDKRNEFANNAQTGTQTTDTMEMRVLHLIDASAGWQQRIAISQLHDRLPAQGIESHIASIDAQAARQAQIPNGRVDALPKRLGLAAMAAPAVRTYTGRKTVNLIHAWGAEAAVAARAAFPNGKPIVVTIFDPGLSDRAVRQLRTVAEAGAFAVACASERVRRRLVERGIPLDATAVLRPAVDFAALSATDGSELRKRLGLPERCPLMLTPPLPGSLDGHMAAVWSVLMRSYLDKSVRIIVPGVGEEVETLARIARTSEHPEVAIFTKDRVRFEQLCAAADWLVVGSVEDIPITSLAWAMAASTPIVAPATYATTELLADGLNARLFKSPDNWRRRGATICTQYDRTEDLHKIKEAARGQAYEVFSLRRMADQHRRLYENLDRGAAPSDGISDPAMIAG